MHTMGMLARMSCTNIVMYCDITTYNFELNLYIHAYC